MRALPFILLLVSCAVPPVNVVQNEPLRVEGDLTFGGVFVGASKQRSITISNPRRTSRTVELQLTAPFSAAERLDIAGGDSVQVQVTFTPTTSGLSETSLTIDEHVVSISGEGLAPLECEAPDACSTARFDPMRGECVATALPEDSACEAPCVTDGHCRSGVCVGAQAMCDDADPCTDDACSVVAGCMHAAASCPAPTNLCHAAVCDAQTGCGVVPVIDGVSCGPDDCIRGTSNVCINGQCVERARPAGLLCFETLAGVAGGPGHVDGRSSDARFYANRVVTVDRFANVVVFDKKGVRRVTPGGLASTLVIADEADVVRDGIGSAGFRRVSTAVADAWGNVLFVDGFGNCVRELTPTGAVRTLAPGCTLPSVTAVARTLDRRVWLITDGNLAELRADGTLVTHRALPGTNRRLGTTASALLFNEGDDVMSFPLDGGTPVRVGTAPSPAVRLWSLHDYGVVYSRITTDGCEHGIATYDGQLTPRYVTPSRGGNTCVEVLDNTMTFAGSMVFNVIAQDDAGLLVMERGSLLGRVSDAGVSTIAGAADRFGRADGFGADAGLDVTAGFDLGTPTYDCITVDSKHDVLFSDTGGRALRSWSDDAGVKTVTRDIYGIRGLSPALDGGTWVVALRYEQLDGGAFVTNHGLHRFEPTTNTLSFSAQLSANPDSGEAMESEPNEGQAAVTPDADSLVLFNPERYLLHFDGRFENDLFFHPRSASFADGTIPDAGITAPRAPVFLPGGDVAFIDGNAVRRLSGWNITTIAGSASAGFVNSAGSNARFDGPLGLALHPNGDLLVADTENNAVRAISPMGLVRTVGRLTDRPGAVAVAPNGDVYVLVRQALLRGR